MVKTLTSGAQGQGAEIPHALWPKYQSIKKKKRKQKQYCKKLKKDFKNGPPQRNLKKKKKRQQNGGVKVHRDTQAEIAELSRMKSGLKLWLIHADI